jgi:hypothetical protein
MGEVLESTKFENVPKSEQKKTREYVDENIVSPKEERKEEKREAKRIERGETGSTEGRLSRMGESIKRGLGKLVPRKVKSLFRKKHRPGEAIVEEEEEGEEETREEREQKPRKVTITEVTQEGNRFAIHWTLKEPPQAEEFQIEYAIQPPQEEEPSRLKRFWKRTKNVMQRTWKYKPAATVQHDECKTETVNHFAHTIELGAAPDSKAKIRIRAVNDANRKARFKKDWAYCEEFTILHDTVPPGEPQEDQNTVEMGLADENIRNAIPQIQAAVRSLQHENILSAEKPYDVIAQEPTDHVTMQNIELIEGQIKAGADFLAQASEHLDRVDIQQLSAENQARMRHMVVAVQNLTVMLQHAAQGATFLR